MTSAIEVNKLRKIYEGGLEALKGIDLSIPQGSFYGLLGPNGAGKTTTIGIITGLVNLTSGTASIMGYDAIQDYRKARRLIGLSPQELNFDVFFSIGELLTLQAGYYGLSHSKAKERTDIMLQQFGLIEKKGYKPKVHIKVKVNKMSFETLTDAARHFNLNPKTVNERFTNKKWTIEESLGLKERE